MYMLKTPLEFLPNFSRMIGRKIWIKRDDCNGDILTAGNKQRKIRLLLADAKSKGADVVLTSGGPQSNHARTTAAMAQKEGLEAILVLGGTEPVDATGNYLLNRIMAAKMLFTGASTQAEMGEALLATAQRLREQGRNPYIIPIGGSNALGSSAYVDAYNELKRQSTEQAFDWLFVSAGSGGTMGGILAGTLFHSDQTRVVGISPWLKAEEIRDKVRQCAEGAAALAGRELSIDGDQVLVSDAYIGEGYGIPTKEGVDALLALARSESILLDYVYTSKAMAGCLDYIKKGIIKDTENILFWHTGGAPSIFNHKVPD